MMPRESRERAMTITKKEIIERASQVFGSRSEAIAWLDRPALALEQRSPASLLRTREGRRIVGNLLLQLEYGVYV